MFQIRDLSNKTDTSRKTIRYYEEIGLLPLARRAENGYRIYDESDVERLRFIRRARALDFALEDIEEILALRDRDEPPCGYVINLMQGQIAQVTAHIRDLERLRDELTALHDAGISLAPDVEMRSCVCHLIEVGIDE